jgi:hypothetical protein
VHAAGERRLRGQLVADEEISLPDPIATNVPERCLAGLLRAPRATAAQVQAGSEAAMIRRI